MVVVADKSGGVPQVGDKRDWWGLSGQPLATTLCQSHLFFLNWEALHFAFIFFYRRLLLKSKRKRRVLNKGSALVRNGQASLSRPTLYLTCTLGLSDPGTKPLRVLPHLHNRLFFPSSGSLHFFRALTALPGSDPLPRSFTIWNSPSYVGLGCVWELVATSESRCHCKPFQDKWDDMVCFP